MTNKFDMAVIGSGPGGYVCAIRAAQLGLSVICIDKRGSHGGTCLNVGCIPSKALLHASELFIEKNKFAAMGIEAENISLNLSAMMSYKDEGVQGNVKGIDYLFKKNKIEGVFGQAKIMGPNKVKITLPDGETRDIEADNIVVATGSMPSSIPGIQISGKRVISSTEALSLSEVPKNLVVVGGGYIGLELGSVWSRLGSNVTVIEYLDRITPGLDKEVSSTFQKILSKQGLTFSLNTEVISITEEESNVIINTKNRDNSEEEEILADYALVSTGRKPYIDNLFDDDIEIEMTNNGFIKTDTHLRTSVNNIWAIGDVVEGPMLAHKAEEEGIAVAELIAGKPGHVNYDIIPSVIYTNPEVASVGMTEEQLKEKSVDYLVGKFPFLANGRAKVNNTTDGFVKILSSADTDQILGIHIIGDQAGNMIGEAAVAMEFEATSEDLARICHAHPTLSEAIKEAALSVEGRALHM
tara:strand:- start:653 stop:2056 length:1404 start_codon:yes stop_codon:yes gene_type:complete